MAMQQTTYEEIKELIQLGDIIAFSGKKRFERLVRLTTRSLVSHTGIVCRTGKTIELVDAVGLKQIHDGDGEGGAVQCRQLAKRVEGYEGLIWWLPLSEAARSRLDLENFAQSLKCTEGKQYTMPQAIRKILGFIEDNPFFDLSTYSQRDFSEFFCSSWAAAALQVAGVFQQVDSAEVTPASLCAFNLFAEDYFQILGRRKELDEFNSMPVYEPPNVR